MKIAVLSNINMDSLKSHLENLNIKDSYFCGYNQYLHELINPESNLYKSEYDYIFIHLDGEELLKDEFYQLKKTNIFADFEIFLNALKEYINQRPDSIIIISNIIFPPFSFSTHLKKNDHTDTLIDIEYKINEKLYALSENDNHLKIMDFKRLTELYGYKQLYDEKYWYLGRIKYTFTGFEKIAAELYALLSVHRGKTKKVLILDLDNTLWGGVIGEDGLNGIQLSEDGIGKCYRDFQKCIKSLKQLGIVLAICSKNNESDVNEVFTAHDMMILKDTDFVIKKINWKNKIENILEISEELNLGLDSFVFIDDNPFERKLVQENLKQVIVPDFPKDVTLLRNWFLTEVVYPYFSKLNLTTEDIEKTSQYKRNVERKKIEKTLNMDEFIKSLEIELTIYKNPKNLINRLAQLTQKTNQFNLTTRRYVEKDIEKFIASKNSNVYAVKYKDKFGDEGIIGEMIISFHNSAAEIDLFLLSCRVIGRNLEFTFLYNILKDLQKQGIESIRALYIPTKKNIIVRNLYKDCGLSEDKKYEYSGKIVQIMDYLSQKQQIKNYRFEQ